MMKHLLIFAPLMFSVWSGPPKPERRPLIYPKDMGTPEGMITEMNKVRRKFAKEYNVSNMHELKWDNDLEQIIRNLDLNVRWRDIKGPWRLAISVNYVNPPALIASEIDSFLGLTDDEKLKAIKPFASRDHMEFVAPLQTQFGCEAANDPKKGDLIICLMAFQLEFSFFEPSATNIPGSDCRDGYENNDGLCSPKESTDYTYLGSQEHFLKNLNIIRKEYASENKLVNVHELTWNEDLERMAENIEWNGTAPPHGNLFRSLRITNFRDTPALVKTTTDEYLEKNEDERKRLLESGDSSKWFLELSAPLQHFVGCSKKYSLTDNHILCLVGPEPKLHFDTKSEDECFYGYQKDKDTNLCEPMNLEGMTLHGHQDGFLKMINDLRRRYAKEKHVPNMHELIWSEDLAKTMDSLDKDDSWSDYNVKFRFSHADHYRFKFNYQDTLPSENYKDPQLEYQLEYLVPLQKMIGCAIHGDVWCLLGPEGTYKLWNPTPDPTVVPGSQCSEGYENNDGLCSPKDPSKVSYFGLQEDFMTEINDLRLQYAVRYHVPNMHKLIWSEDLAQIMDSTYHSDLENYSNPRRRTVILESYYGIKKLVDNELEQLSKSTDREESFKKLTSLELVNPLQFSIGCGKKYTEKKSFIACFIGTSGEFELFDFQGNQVPGSKCSRGFKNEDGYCAPKNLTTVTYLGMPEVFMEDLNDLRRELARNYSIPDMHEMIWSSELEESVKNNEASGRYAWIQNYEDQKSQIFESLQQFLAKTDTEKSDFLKTNSESKELLELLNPDQKKLGCAIKDQSGLPIVCVLGEEKDFKLWDFEGKSGSDPGINCSSGYENFYGLCVLEGSKDSEKTTATVETTLPNTTTLPPLPTRPPRPPLPTQKSPSENPKESEKPGKTKNPPNPQNPEKQTSESEEPKKYPVLAEEDEPLEDSKSENWDLIFSLLVFSMISVYLGF